MLGAAQIEQRRLAASGPRRALRPSRWKGEELARLRADYEGDSLSVQEIEAKYGANRGHFSRLARQYGWKRRCPRLPQRARDQWNLYRKVHRIAGRKIALQAVLA